MGLDRRPGVMWLSALPAPPRVGLSGLERKNNMWYWHGMDPWGWLLMVAYSAVVIFGIVWAAQTTSERWQRNEDGALRTLDQRLTRGEVDAEDHEERRWVLESHP